MNRCKSCKHWTESEDHFLSHLMKPYDWEAEEPMKFDFEVRYCDSPSLLFSQRPLYANEAAVADASDYMASMLTAEGFGCVNWEESGNNERQKSQKEEKRTKQTF